MKLTDRLKRFINQNSNLIDSNRFDNVFFNAITDGIPLGDVSELLIRSGIDFLPYVDHIYTYMFHDVQELERLTLSDNIEYIGAYAFNDCTNLKYLSLPKELKMIKFVPFAHCSNLQVLNYRGTIDDWDKVQLNPSWNRYSSIKVIRCLDGDINI